MRRRHFLGGVGALAVLGARGARAQSERVRRVGILLPWTDSDAEGQQRVTAFVQALQQLGWSFDEIFRIDYRLSDSKVQTCAHLPPSW